MPTTAKWVAFLTVVMAMPIGLASAATYQASSGNNFGIYVDSADGTATLMLICSPQLVVIERGGDAAVLTFARLDLRVNSDATFGEGKRGRAYVNIAGSGDSFGYKPSEFNWSYERQKIQKEIGIPFVRTIDVDSTSIWKAIESNEQVAAELTLVDDSIEDESGRSRTFRFSFDLSELHKQRVALDEKCRSSDSSSLTPIQLY